MPGLLLFSGLLALPLMSLSEVSPAAATEPAAATAPVQAAPSDPAGQSAAASESGEDGCPSTFGPIITDTAVPIEEGKLAAQPTFSLGFVTHALSPSWRRVSAGGDFGSFSGSLKLTYGLLNNLEAFVVLPFIHNWVNNCGDRNLAANYSGIGDFSLTLKYRLVEETAALPTVSALFTTVFPTGHYKSLNPGRQGVDQTGGGAYVFTTGLNHSKYLKPFIFYGNLWYSMGTAFSTRGEDEDGNSIYLRNYPRDVVTVNLAAEYPITKKWVALLELTSYWDGGRLIGHKANVPPSALLAVMPALEYMATDKFSLALGLNIDLVGKNTAAALIPMLSMVYAF